MGKKLFGVFGAFTLGPEISICPLEVHLGGERFQKNCRPLKNFPPKLGVFEIFGISKKTFILVDRRLRLSNVGSDE